MPLYWPRVEVRQSERKLGPVILDLGHMTVFCGKNNAGKSTILNCIIDSQKKDSGFAFVSRKVAKSNAAAVFESIFENDVIQFTLDYSITLNELLNEIYDGISREVVHEAVGKSVEWIREVLTEREIRPANADAICKSFQGKLTEVFVSTPKIRSLVDERKMPHTDAVHPQIKAASPMGANIVNNLFLSKNATLGEDPNDGYGTRFFELVKSTFHSLTDGVGFNIGAQNQLRFVLSNGETITRPEATGRGLLEMLHFAYRIHEPDVDILVVDEPELHLHIGAQQRLIRTMHEQRNKQFVVATHSGVFTDTRYVDKLYVVEWKDGIEVKSVESQADALYGIGHCPLDDLTADLVLMVEGPTDVHYYRSLLGQMNVDPQWNVRYWPMKGSQMHQIDIGQFTPIFPICIILDKDPWEKRDEYIENARRAGALVSVLERYSIENYVGIEVYRKHFPDMPVDVSSIEPDIQVKDQLGLNPKGRSHRIARDIDIEDIKSSDLIDILKEVRKLVSARVRL